MAKVNVVAVLATAGGALLLYSAVTGRTFSKALRQVLAGNSPGNAPVSQGVGTTVIPGSSELPQGTAGISVGTPAPGETGWVRSLLTAIGAPSTQANINSIQAWIAHEGPYGSQGPNNPLNTTEQGYGGWNWYGSVKGYPSAASGLEATVATLLGGNYNDVVAQLRTGGGLCGQSFASLGEWSGGGYTSVC